MVSEDLFVAVLDYFESSAKWKNEFFSYHRERTEKWRKEVSPADDATLQFAYSNFRNTFRKSKHIIPLEEYGRLPFDPSWGWTKMTYFALGKSEKAITTREAYLLLKDFRSSSPFLQKSPEFEIIARLSNILTKGVASGTIVANRRDAKVTEYSLASKKEKPLPIEEGVKENDCEKYARQGVF